MGSKLGFILSLLFVVQLFALAGDIMSIQMIYSNLDAVGVTAGYIISRSGQITDEVVNLVYEEAGASIEQIGDTPPLIGATYRYRIYKTYESLILQSELTEIAIVRSVVIGYYS